MTFTSASNQTVGGGFGGMVPGLSPEDLTALREVYLQGNSEIKGNAEEHAKIMAKLDAGGFGGFNVWAAFFLGIWMPGRKLYRYWPVLVFLIAVALLPSIIFHLAPFENHTEFFFGYFAATFLTAGLMGWKWLWCATGLEIKRALSITQGDLEQTKIILRNRGGTSFLAAIIGLTLLVGTSYFLNNQVLGNKLPACSAEEVKSTLVKILNDQGGLVGVRVLSASTQSSQGNIKYCSARVSYKHLGSDKMGEINFKVTKVDNRPGEFFVSISQ